MYNNLVIDQQTLCDHKVVLNFWEESDKKMGITQDGCSLHLTEIDRKKYIYNIYSKRKGDIPDSYERPIGNFGYNVYITDEIYDRLLEEKNIRLSQVELKNLMAMEEIFIVYL
jgi:hypothetical protein